MMPLFSSRIKSSSQGRVSTLVLYALIAITVILFGCFFFIGYDRAYEENPMFLSPLLTDVVLIFVLLLVLSTILITACSVFLSIKRRDSSSNEVNNIPENKIILYTSLFLVLCLIVTFCFGSSEPLKVNGSLYEDTFWLKTTDMLIITGEIMLIVAIIGVALGLSGLGRRIKKKPSLK